MKFQPNLLNSFNEKERAPQVEMLYGLFRHIAQFSNQNLHRNVANLNLQQKRNVIEMDWSVSSNARFDSSKFKLTYLNFSERNGIGSCLVTK